LQADRKNSSQAGGMPTGFHQVVGTVRCAVRAAPSGATCGVIRTSRRSDADVRDWPLIVFLRGPVEGRMSDSYHC